MALKDNAVLVIDTGNYYLAAPGTAAPADLRNPGPEWTNVGHTSVEDIFTISSEGGDATSLGTLQNKNLRTSYAARTETLGFVLQQFDEDSLKLYFGRNAAELAEDARFLGVPETPQPTIAAFLGVFVDGEEEFAVYAQKAEILRGDDLELSDTSSLAGMPLNVTPKKHGTNPWTWALTPIGLGVVATGATAGTPGTYTPEGAVAPFSESSLDSVTASPLTAWTVGQYVALGNGTEWYWDGTDWASGRAPA